MRRQPRGVQDTSLGVTDGGVTPPRLGGLITQSTLNKQPLIEYAFLIFKSSLKGANNLVRSVQCFAPAKALGSYGPLEAGAATTPSGPGGGPGPAEGRAGVWEEGRAGDPGAGTLTFRQLQLQLGQALPHLGG